MAAEYIQTQVHLCGCVGRQALCSAGNEIPGQSASVAERMVTEIFLDVEVPSSSTEFDGVTHGRPPTHPIYPPTRYGGEARKERASWRPI